MLDKLDPKVDFVFKPIFGLEENKDVMLDFLNATDNSISATFRVMFSK